MLKKFDHYRLLDFGGGRKLERFGNLIVNRPSPPALHAVPKTPKRWQEADLFFRTEEGARTDSALGVRGSWKARTDHGAKAIESGWNLDAGFILELKCSPFGHLGVFPEQARNWTRLYEYAQNVQERLRRPARILNLFAYTGGSTLACAAGGAEVTHLDAARNIVAQARRNAELSGFAERPIRWIADDAVKYAKREQKRGNLYDGIVLDPPAYGHGARGEVWRLARDLPKLLDILFAILDREAPFVLLTCHSPGFDARRLKALLEERGCTHAESGSMAITAETGAKLDAGCYALFR